MPLPLTTEVVEENTMAAEDTAISPIPATTPIEVVVVGVDMDIMGDTIQPILKSHNVSCVASLVILFMFVTIVLISHIKTHKTMVLPL
jgi:sensor histidine kinase regulating citrate/malate metabolism